MGRRELRKRKSRRGKVLKILFLIVLLIGTGTALLLYQSIQGVLSGDDLHSSRDVSLKDKEGFTVLLLGVDEREGDRGRSDTMMFMSINGEEETAKMLSIPRDTRVTLAGRGTEEKINHAYAFGGVKMAAETVEDFLDVPVDYYVEMNMEGLEEIVDAVGGVDVQNEFAFSYGGDEFPEGRLTLSGSEALNYTRMRKEDPNGDFGRQARQRQVIEGILDKGNNPSMIFKFNDIMGALGNNMQTNLSIGEITTIQRNYAQARNHIETVTIDGHGERISGVYYYMVDDQEKERVSHLFKEHLGLN